MYAECVVRGAGGSLVTATDYINALRTQCYRKHDITKEI
jgi:adenosylmethionine-8-amino-7-oxononanoate aminotransferase